MAEGLDQQAFTVKDWLQRIDSKQDKLDEKIDGVIQTMDRKADDRDLRAAVERILVLEQVNAQRLEMWGRIDKRVENNSALIEDLKEDKADRSELGALWKILLSALAGSSVAILAWALTVFAR